MSKKKFDVVVKYEGRRYRFNSKEHLLEWVDENYEVVDCIGLNAENAEKNLMGYVAEWHMQLEEELNYERMFL